MSTKEIVLANELIRTSRVVVRFFDKTRRGPRFMCGPGKTISFTNGSVLGENCIYPVYRIWVRCCPRLCQRTSWRASWGAKLVRYTIGEWTLNALLTKSNSFKKCSKPRISGRSAQAISLPQIAGMTKYTPEVPGSGSGRISVSAADPRIQGLD